MKASEFSDAQKAFEEIVMDRSATATFPVVEIGAILVAAFV